MSLGILRCDYIQCRLILDKNVSKIYQDSAHKHSVFCHFLEIHGHSLERDPDSVFNCLSVCVFLCSDDNDTRLSKLLRASLSGTSG